METSLFRLVLLLSLLLVLTGDYYSMMAQLFQTISGLQSAAEVPQLPPSDREPNHNSKEDTSELFQSALKSKILVTIKNSCLPKLICELHATTNKEKLSESERSLLALIRDTSISTTAEVTSKYHFAAHMGQLISGVEGNGCHNFYPTCPFAGLQVMQMMKKIRVR